MTFSEQANKIFNKSISDYHVHDDIDAPLVNPYAENTIEHKLYQKNWIDTVQWHLEDIIRDPQIDTVAALALKRRIDRSNQERTDLVEEIDNYFYSLYHNVVPLSDATFNTESPAWAVDRLSILALKIYHMKEQTLRADATPKHRNICQEKLDILLRQQSDLSLSINQLLDDYVSGRKYMRVYRQMKMYNDVETNPVLYGKKK